VVVYILAVHKNKYAQFHAHIYAECVQGIAIELQVFSLNPVTDQFCARNLAREAALSVCA
jgi:hypothetical protein